MRNVPFSSPKSMSGKKCFLVIASLVIVGLVAVRFFDPLSRRLAGGYRLNLFSESGEYYVDEPGVRLTRGGGVFDGTVEKVGWSDTLILARVTRIWGGDPNGWYVLDVETKIVRGPLTDQEINTDPFLARIECFECNDPRVKRSGR